MTEIRNWPKAREHLPNCADLGGYACTCGASNFNTDLSLCASVVRGNLMTHEEIAEIIYKFHDEEHLQNVPIHVISEGLAKRIVDAQHSKMFGEGK